MNEPLGGIVAGVTAVGALWQVVGGRHGFRHPRVWAPLVGTAVLFAIALTSAFLIDLIHAGRVSESYHRFLFWMACSAGVLGVVALMWTFIVGGGRRRVIDAILAELEEEFEFEGPIRIRTPGDPTRTLALLDELQRLLGPMRVAPGHPWATSEWITSQRSALTRGVCSGV